jgi:hypothetical protein
MVQYATATELAGYLQQDLDTYTANQVLTLASNAFSQAAATWFEATSATYVTLGSRYVWIRLPFRPVTAVAAVRINGATVTGWTVIKNVVYRAAGFGLSYVIPPDEVEIDLTHGYTAPTDDVKAAVLETAATAYVIPVSAVAGEQIDDYIVRYTANEGGIRLTPSAAALAAQYRGTLAA